MKVASKMIIRKMKNSDVKAIADSFVEQGWDGRTKVLVNYFSEQEAGRRAVFVAEVDGVVAGYVTLIPLANEGPFQYKFPEIKDFNVFEKFQKRGVGNALLGVAEEVAQKNAPTVTLGVGLHEGYGAAQRLYVKRGYIPDGSGVWYRNAKLLMNAPSRNDDDLVLYLAKNLN